ncbi:MAG: hypothetical protein ABIK98_05305 [Pseudomonadota bacterium]|nr:hypothetical protein [Pseudomonadota bacterium]
MRHPGNIKTLERYEISAFDPSNIMLTKRGEVKLMDFGISRFLKEDPKDGPKISGTPYYMLKQSPDAVQVKFLREFYNIKILQLVDANLRLIRAGK